MKKNNFAEIIASSLASWQARSWQWDYAPTFGSLVTISQKDRQLFGIIHQIELGSSDPTRQPYAYQKTEEELKAEQPQIFEFLMTTFLIAPVGFIEENTLHYQLPPIPPKIHGFVAHASGEEEILFFSDPSFLYTLFNLAGTISQLDELLLALLKKATRNNAAGTVLPAFIQTFNQLAHNDYNRIRLFCQRAQKIVSSNHV